MLPGRLWENPDFLRLWAGQSVSALGSMIGGPALGFTAILFLEATPLQMGMLQSADLLPALLVGLPAGVWVDRLRKRPLLIASDLARALLLALIPLTALLGLLRIEIVLTVVFLVGALNLLFDVAYQSHLPCLVAREDLVEGNSKLAASASAAEVAGFATAGWLVQILTAPIAVGANACSFLISAAYLSRIRKPEPAPVPSSEREGVWREMVVGAQAVLREPLLRALAASTLLFEFFGRVIGTVIVLFMTRELGFSPGVLGMIWAVGGICSFSGALVAGPLARRVGVGRTMVLGLIASAAGVLLVPLAEGANWVSALLLIGNQVITDPGWMVYDIHQTSVRQSVTPDHLLGRVNAGMRFLALAAMLAGALVGGLLGQALGLRATLVVGSAGTLVSAVVLALSPAGRLRRIGAAAAGTRAAP